MHSSRAHHPRPQPSVLDLADSALRPLDSAGDLLVAWLETPGESALAVEQTYLQAFKAQHGSYPFANRRG